MSVKDSRRWHRIGWRGRCTALRAYDKGRRWMRDTLLRRLGDREMAGWLEDDGPVHVCADVSKYRSLVAASYQMAGVLGAPERFLDALSAAAAGREFSVDGLLPVGIPEPPK